MRLSPHLSFDGTCREAFGFYERVLGGSIVTMLTYGESPMAADVPMESHDRIAHATLLLGLLGLPGESVLSGADALPGQYEPPRGFQVLLQPPQAEESRRVFDLFADGGEIMVPVQETFWTPVYGALVDRFGVPWEISCESQE